MSESEIQVARARAEAARRRLAQDLTRFEKVGKEMINTGESALKKAVPIVAILGIVAVGALLDRKKRHATGLDALLPKQRSFVRDALRAAALSAISVFTTRLVEQANLPGLPPKR